MEQVYYIIGDRKVTGNGKDLGPVEETAETQTPAEVTPQEPAPDLQAQLTELIAERDQLKTRVEVLESQQSSNAQQLQVPEGAQLLPADARDRLISIDGISERIADEALAALGVQSVASLESQPEVAQASESSTPAETGETTQTQKTGDLPGNVVGAGKLKAIGVTTWEGLRDTSDQALADAGLDADQVARLRTLSS